MKQKHGEGRQVCFSFGFYFQKALKSNYLDLREPPRTTAFSANYAATALRYCILTANLEYKC